MGKRDSKKKLTVDKGYEYKGTDANFRIATVDPDKLFITLIYSAGSAKSIWSIKENFEDKGLIYISNATFTSTVFTPLADIVGYKHNVAGFLTTPTHYKVDIPNKNWHRRWYFAIYNDGRVEIKHPQNNEPDFVWDGFDHAAFGIGITGTYRMIAHGGIILFDQTDAKLTLPASETLFKDIVIKYNDNTWQNTNDNAWKQAHGGIENPRTAVALLTGGKIAFISSGWGKMPEPRGGMKLFPFATALMNIGAIKAILFDGSRPVASWAKPRLDEPFPCEPQALPNEGAATYFAVFEIANTRIKKIGKIDIPKNDTQRKEPLPVFFDSPFLPQSTTPIQITLNISKSNYFKPTVEARLYIMGQNTYQTKFWQGNEPTNLEAIVKIWSSTELANQADQDFAWIVPNNPFFHLLIASDPNRSLIIVFRSQATAGWQGEIIYEHVLPLKPIVGVRTVFLMDNSKNVQSQGFFISMRNDAIKKVAYNAFQRSTQPIQIGALSGITANFSMAGFYEENNPVPRWKDNLNDFLACYPYLAPTSFASDYNWAFKMLGLCFEGCHTLDKKTAIFLAMGPHRPLVDGENPVFDTAVINLFSSSQIQVHCIGYGLSPADQQVLANISNSTGGIAKAIYDPHELLDVFTEIYSKDQKENYIKKFTFVLVPNHTFVQTFVFFSFGTAAIRVFYDSDKISVIRVALKSPNGTVFVSGQPPPQGAHIDQGAKHTVFIISNPLQFDDFQNKVWTAEVQTGRSNQVEKEGAEEERLEIIISQGDSDSQNKIQLKQAILPGENAVDKDLAVAVEESKEYLPAEEASFMVKNVGESSYTKYPLQKSDQGVWRGIVPGGQLELGLLQGYFIAKRGYLSALLPHDAPTSVYHVRIVSGPSADKIVFKDHSIPAKLVQGSALTAKARFSLESCLPEKVRVIFHYKDDSESSILLENQDNGYWQGTISPSYIHKPGTIYSYLQASKGIITALAPENAPQQAFTTVVTSEPVGVISLAGAQLPSTTRACESVTTFVRVAKESLQPGKITVYAARSDKIYFPFFCSRLPNGQWQGTIPASLFFPGTVYAYFVAEVKHSLGIEPARLPATDAFQIKVKLEGGMGYYLTNMLYPHTLKAGQTMQVSVNIKRPPPPPVSIYFRGRNIHAKNSVECQLNPVQGDTWVGSIPGSEIRPGTLYGHFFAKFGSGSPIFEIYPRLPGWTEYATTIK